MKFNAIVAVGLASNAVLAHPEVLPRGEIARRGMMSKRCEPAAASFNKKRYEQRMNKRAVAEAKRDEFAGYSRAAETPYYDVIQNDTCVLAPEVTWGPYVYPNSQTLRTVSPRSFPRP